MIEEEAERRVNAADTRLENVPQIYLRLADQDGGNGVLILSEGKSLPVLTLQHQKILKLIFFFNSLPLLTSLIFFFLICIPRTLDHKDSNV